MSHHHSARWWDILENRQTTYFWILFKVKLVNVARYSNIETILGPNKILTIFCICAMVRHFKEIMVAWHLLIKWWTFYWYFPLSVPAEVQFAENLYSILNYAKGIHEKYDLAMVRHLCLPHAIFKASALWADALYKLKCLSVCPSVCLCFCSLLRYRV